MYKHVTWQHLNQYMTSKSRGHCDNIKVFNQGKSNQIREKSGKSQGIWLLKMCGHPVLFLDKNLLCWYSLEAPHWGASYKYTKYVFVEKYGKYPYF